MTRVVEGVTTNILGAITLWGLLAFTSLCAAQETAPVTRPEAPLVVDRTFPLFGTKGDIGPITAHPDGARLYIVGVASGSVTRIDIVRRRYLGSMRGLPEPSGMAIAGERLIVSLRKGHGKSHIVSINGKNVEGTPGVCWVFDAADDGEIWKPALGEILKLPDADHVRPDPDGTHAWVGYRDGGLALVDPDKPGPVADVGLDGHPAAFEVEQKGNRIYVNVPKAGHVAVVNRSERKVTDRWKLMDAKENGPMALDEPGHRLFVICKKPAKVLVYDTERGRVVAWAACAADAGDVHFDQSRHRLYVTGDGAISVLSFEKDKLKPLSKIAVAPGVRTSAWIPSSSSLCVGVPIKGKDSEVWVYKAQP